MTDPITDAVWHAGRALAANAQLEELVEEFDTMTTGHGTLWVATSTSSAGKTGMETIRSTMSEVWRLRLEAEGTEAIRMGDTLYRVRKSGKMNLSVRDFVEYISQHHPEHLPDILEAAVAPYNIRTSFLLNKVDELLGSNTRDMVKDTFIHWEPSASGGTRLDVGAIKAKGTPRWAEDMLHGEKRPRKETKHD